MTKTSPLAAHLERILAAASIPEIWALHCDKMAEFGFDRLLYGFTRFRTPNSFGSADDVLVLSNHDQAYLDEFIKSGIYNHAPMVKWAAANEGPGSWRLIEEIARSGEMTETERTILELNLRYDVRCGYSIGFRDVSVRAKGAIGLCARRGMVQDDV